MALLQAPPELKIQLVAHGTTMYRPAGSFLFRRGDPVSGIYLICSGAVRLGMPEEPEAFPSREGQVGSILGLPATLSGSPYSLSAEVVEDSRLIFLSRADLLTLLRDQQPLCFEVMQVLTNELVDTRGALERVHKVGV